MRAKTLVNSWALVLASAFLLTGCMEAMPDTTDTASGHNCSAPTRDAAPARDGAQAEEVDPHAFAARAGGVDLTLVRVDGQYITGPNVSLGLYDEDGQRAIRGIIDQTVVDLRVDSDRVSGAIGNGPVALRVIREDNTLAVRGVMPGRVSHFQIDPSGMRGTIGGCMYSLKREANGFAGRRRCSSTMHNFTLELPQAMASWSDAEVAAVLALFLYSA